MPSEAEGAPTPPLHPRPTPPPTPSPVVQEAELHWLRASSAQPIVGSLSRAGNASLNSGQVQTPWGCGWGEAAERRLIQKIHLSDSSCPCPVDTGGSTHTLLDLSCPHLHPRENSEPGSRDRVPGKCSQGAQVPSPPSLPPRTEELGCPGLSCGPAGKWPPSGPAHVALVACGEMEGPLSPDLSMLPLLEVGKEAPGSARPPPGTAHAPHPHRDQLSQGCSAHLRDEEAEASHVSQVAQGHRAKRGHGSRPLALHRPTLPPSTSELGPQETSVQADV